MDSNEKKIKKLTEKDVPELKTDNPSPEQMYCRFHKQTWSGWETIKCSGNYASESACASDAQWAGADAYSWTGRSC